MTLATARADAAIPSPASLARTQADRYVLLDGLRGVLALSVVIHHFSATSGHREFFASAGLAVDFFFCLSGFVIAAAYEEKLRNGMALGAFMGRRLMRLYPMYLAGFVLGVVAIYAMDPGARDALAPFGFGRAMLANAVYLPYPNGAAIPVQATVIAGALFPFNNPAWSLFFELVANAGYVLVARISTAALAVMVTLLGIGMVLAWSVYGTEPGWSGATFVGGIWRTAYGFFMGVLLYRVHRARRTWSAVDAFALALAVAALVAIPHHSSSAYWIVTALFAVPPLVAAAASCNLSAAPRARAWCDYWGRLSYPMYCLHYPLLVALFGGFVLGAPAYALELGIYVAVVLVASHLLLTRFDEPLRRRLAHGSIRA
ncbi:MAG TPA: acyltransferase [Usitatibacter sp.]|jgi:peptidoglycan/LPS O-acetylase OafA/YrhL|nr:acyltransferase [Usitatibacter sp.]